MKKWDFFISLASLKFLQLENQIFHRANRLKPNWTTSNVGGENLKNDRLKMFLIQFSEFLGYKKRDLANSLPKLLAVILTAIRLNPVQWSEFNQPYFKDNTKKSKSQVEQKKRDNRQNKKTKQNKNKQKTEVILCIHQKKSQIKTLKT